MHFPETKLDKGILCILRPPYVVLCVIASANLLAILNFFLFEKELPVLYLFTWRSGK